MNLMAIAVVAGVLGTLAMDVLNYLCSRTGLIAKVDIRMIGRMSAGWTRGRFRYRHPDEMVAVANELLLGYIAHYSIGVGLAVPFISGWGLLVGGSVSPAWTFVYGVATTIASVFFVYPAMGLGIFGRRSPDGIKAPLSSLANHVFFGGGMAAGVALF